MDFRNLKRLSLGFENSEEISLNPKEIIRFWLRDINAHVTYTKANGIIEYPVCGELFLELSAQADRHYDWYGERSEQTVFQRLACPDLTSVELIYEDGTSCYQNSGRRLRENLLAQKQSWTKLAYQGSTLMCSGTLLPELERIRRPAAVQCPVGYPVHYLIQAEDRPHMQKITKVLLQALYQAGRLESRRYCVCDLEDIKGYRQNGDKIW